LLCAERQIAERPATTANNEEQAINTLLTEFFHFPLQVR